MNIGHHCAILGVISFHLLPCLNLTIQWRIALPRIINVWIPIGIVLEEHYIKFYYLTINELFDKVVRLDNCCDSSLRFEMKVNA